MFGVVCLFALQKSIESTTKKKENKHQEKSFHVNASSCVQHFFTVPTVSFFLHYILFVTLLYFNFLFKQCVCTVIASKKKM